ncbi:HEPN domain-containing protein [Clostridium gasigenes]|uniref:RiboL-PSP-HEPN domain-containing protein n=1 Tax=Clostridium gasigenes TaxID=94869 RepID=A0A1H0VGL2_9CLOT|nr:HEPN domain-containing protein [Clostridium gasigenes]SDP77473.1 hypothetical protein SAMN04488529_11659 [Clostridium gasigenes]
MQDIILKYDEFKKHLLTLKEYVLFNKKEREAKYSDYRDIVYGAIINRGYSLWETYVKDIFYEYFILKKDEYYENNTLIGKYKISELPAYLFEDAILNEKDDIIMFKLNRQVISFTSKNMDMNEMRNLFKKLDIEINNTLDNNMDLNEAVNLFEISFENGLDKDKKTTQGLKRLIEERNFVSHYAHIDTFQDLEILLEWINFYILLGKTLCKFICLEYVKGLSCNKSIIGECKNALTKRNMLLVDIGDKIKVDKTSLLYVYSNNILIDILKPISFQVEGSDVEFVQAGDKAGINIKTIFDYDEKIRAEYKYYIIENI